MKTCNGCKYAIWRATANGRLHPSGDGRCAYQYKIPPVPSSFYFISEPHPCGGHISRKRELKDHCAYWCSVEDTAVHGNGKGE